MLKQIKVNHKLRNKVIIPNRLFFAGGYPKYHVIPKLVKWGKYISLYWLDIELVYKY